MGRRFEPDPPHQISGTYCFPRCLRKPTYKPIRIRITRSHHIQLGKLLESVSADDSALVKPLGEAVGSGVTETVDSGDGDTNAAAGEPLGFFGLAEVEGFGLDAEVGAINVESTTVNVLTAGKLTPAMFSAVT